MSQVELNIEKLFADSFFLETLSANMKAKEFAQQYLNSNNKSEESVKIAMAFLSDFQKMMIARNIRSVDAVTSLLNEFENKWKIYATLVNEKLPVTTPILYNGFRNIIYLSCPNLKEYW
ncbi:MAG: hypothetical protein EOM59_15875 [Clostridia bacterium]|nr:hypothetical protein [Clostridia bacterium]